MATGFNDCLLIPSSPISRLMKYNKVRDMIEWVYGCLSEDTEILTANGWKMLYSVFEGDYVFACDYKNDMKLQLEPVKQKFIYDYDEDAYHIKDTGYYNSELMETDHIVSKNHNVLVSESWARDCFSNGEYPQKVAAEVLYKNVQKRKELGHKSDFHIPGLNGFIPCTIEKIPYKGKVWCVEVESGAFVARRKGKIFITGNSGFPKSLNIGKAVDKLQGNERKFLGIDEAKLARFNSGLQNQNDGYDRPWMHREDAGMKKAGITKGTSEWAKKRYNVL